MNTYLYEYCDTFAGESNYRCVKRGYVSIPELTHYGYDGSKGYWRANKIAKRKLIKKVKRELGLTGVRGVSHDYGRVITFYPYNMSTVIVITYCDV